MKLKEIHRASTFAWGPVSGECLIATGTVAGALDASFSNDSQLEIWNPDFGDDNQFDLGGEGQEGAIATVVTSSRFNRLSWGGVDASRPKGIIAGGMENGELSLWDPTKLMENASDSVIFSNTTHTGPIRGLDFNPLQTNLLSSGSVNGEVYIWNLQEPSKPYTPGTRSSKLDEITSLAWNRQVPYILATSGNTGYTVVWDLRHKREVAVLAYTGSTVAQVGGGMAMGGRKGMSDVVWHPNNATRLVTSSEDDSSPVVMLWDLRNARAPEKVLNGHEKGVLSVSWCKHDADLLLSCGKDNRSICWNPQTSEILGELPIANNWAFQVQFSPSNPSLVANAAFDGTISMHNLQSLNAPDAEAIQAQSAVSPQAEGADLFDLPQTTLNQSQPSLNLLQAPKWLKTPSAASWGYGGKLISISNLPAASGTNQSNVIHLRDISTEKDLVERAQKLGRAADGQDGLKAYVEERAKQSGPEEGTWKALLSLFDANSRDELVNVLGFSKDELRVKVEDAISAMSAKVKAVQEDKEELAKPHEPVVSFAEPTHSPVSDGTPELTENTITAEQTPSEVSNEATSDATTTKTTSALSTLITEPESASTASLFGEDVPTGTPQPENPADFFSSMGTIRGPVPPHVLVPHTNPAPDSSVAATAGSRPSSAASDALSLKNVTFKMYPKEESVVDKLITQSLVVGDFESAVSLCLSAERYADAILLAVRGGNELLQRTQKAYFEKKTVALPYLRVYQSIVTNDISDIVQNADLKEWQEIFVVLCTFAKADDFWNLAEQLGQRLEFQGNIIKGSDLPDGEKESAALRFRKNATLCYLAASKLEKVVNIWLEEMKEMEDASKEAPKAGDSRYATHAQALQTFIEKVTVFRSATKYVDADLSQSVPSAGGENIPRAHKLSSLYDRYFEYADLLASQGLVNLAVEYINLVPSDYTGLTNAAEFDLARERLLLASGAKSSKKTTLPTPAASTSRAPAAGYPYDSYAGTQQIPVAPSVPAPASYTMPPAAPQTGVYGSHYGHARPSSQPPTQPSYGAPAYGAPNGGPGVYGGGGYAPSGSMVPPPPAPITSSGGSTPALPQAPPRKVENKVGGWNDAPPIVSKSGANANAMPKRAPIMSPFPQGSSPAQIGSPGMSPGGLPPPPPRGQTPVSRIQQGPPRPGSGQGTLPPPPTRGSQFSGVPPPPIGSGFAPPPQQQRGMPPPPGRGVAPPQMAPQGSFPPSRTFSPPQQQQQQQQQTVGGSFPPPPPGPGRITSPPQAAPPMRAAPPMMAPPQMRTDGFQRGTPPPGPNTLPAAPPQQQGTYTPRTAPGPGGVPPPQVGSFGAPPSQPAPPTGPPPPGPPRGMQAPPKAPTPSAPPKSPAQPKYPPGDRSHIPDSSKPIYEAFSAALDRLKQTTPPQSKRMVDDVERRVGQLFDALNCETLSPPVLEELQELAEMVRRRDHNQALAIHAHLLTNGSKTNDIGLWMSGVKQLINRL